MDRIELCKKHRLLPLRRISRTLQRCISQESSELQSLLAKDNIQDLEENAKIRQHKINLPLIKQLVEQLNQKRDQEICQQLHLELNRIPNTTHPRLKSYGLEPKELFQYYSATEGANECSKLCKRWKLLRMDHLTSFAGHKSYYLLGSLAQCEQELIAYAIETLKKNKFKIIYVPDILTADVIESCGMQTDSERTQVYKIDSGECLSGTSEMALAGFFANEVHKESCLPLKVAAVSRCYRAETSALNEEKGLYRVHQFNKVEMFSICTEKQSEEMLETFKEIQISFFQKLGLSFRVLDMPPHELGLSAYCKFDIEAWMPGKNKWGEISSCSNCTDFQTKRLNILYRRKKDGSLHYAHSVNGTAAAVPRLLISIVESNKMEEDCVTLPPALKSRIGSLNREKRLPELKLFKTINCGQFSHACVIVEPLELNTNRIHVKARQEISKFVCLSEPKIVSDHSAPFLARQLALHAHLAKDVYQRMHKNKPIPYVSNWLERLMNFKRLKIVRIGKFCANTNETNNWVNQQLQPT